MNILKSSSSFGKKEVLPYPPIHVPSKSKLTYLPRAQNRSRSEIQNAVLLLDGADLRSNKVHNTRHEYGESESSRIFVHGETKKHTVDTL